MSWAQDPRAILRRCEKESERVEHGWYAMIHDMKYITGTDTVRSYYECDFCRVKGKHPFPSTFCYAMKDSVGKVVKEVEYNGLELLEANPNEMIVTVMARNKWEKQIIAFAHNHILYDLLTDAGNKTLKAARSGHRQVLQRQEAIEMIEDRACYHIQVQGRQNSSVGAGLQLTHHQQDLWIDTLTYLPMRHAVTYDLALNGDTMRQYEDMRLVKLDLAQPRSSLNLGERAKEAGYRFEEYSPAARKEPLAVGSVAPDWRVDLLHGDSLGLKDLQGKVVLLDFFYRTCAPCMHALPALSQLHSKYAPEGLVVMGLDPKDKDAEQLASFLDERDVPYPVGICPAELAEAYHVNGYPTVFLLDRAGKVLFVQTGYAEGSEAALERRIKEALEQGK